MPGGKNVIIALVPSKAPALPAGMQSNWKVTLLSRVSKAKSSPMYEIFFVLIDDKSSS